MQNNNRKRSNEAAQDSNPVSQAAALAVIGSLIATLGDGITTVAAVLALQEAQQEAQQPVNGGGNIDLQGINQQLNYLTKEVKKIKKTLNI
ncbi:hypothetical protein [Lysinibacillus odysseyi]|uniref:Multidrug ABC transporter ATPase n=1 Tax=Lysinibacillus odysseyi 34hs-1 = NBRC 100172 TaxID=1220589 RepID=A0A0A3IF80_9BACI|nr:hypothetical protein [Lysinibacillus odysseyi]KGR83354.1 multidrug ABC transporter ATPase [Lysinibacillus odysseyi 34hs-1 = NBRC 100172]